MKAWARKLSRSSPILRVMSFFTSDAATAMAIVREALAAEGEELEDLEAGDVDD